MNILLLAAIAALQPAPAAPAAEAEHRIFEASAYIFDFEAEDDDWFQFGGSSQRFRLPSNERELDTYLRLLSTAQERRVRLTVRYDAMAGRADAEGVYVEYPLCALAAPTGASFGDEAANCPPRPAPSGEAGERALALGLALVPGQPAAARRRLGEAIADPRLAPSLRVLALQARGRAAEIMAFALPSAGDAFDRASLEALADYRAWVAADPAEPRAHYAAARMLTSLGGYQEAMAIYRAMGRRWPDEAFQLAIHTGALFRQQGRYREALAAFDAYLAQAEPREGMPLHFHRGWVLQLLGRPAEAVTELSRGLESQPDYASAFLMRSCAHAKLGRLREALADQERALELLGGANAGVAEDLARSRALVETLRHLAASGRQRPTDAPCTGFWDDEIRPRPRSALLGPAPR